MDASPELETAVALAREFDLPVEQPQVLREGSSVIVLLSPAGPVARVGGLTAEVRDLRAHFARELAVARFLSEAGAPVVAPAEPARRPPAEPGGPHERDGRVVTFWARAPDGPPPDGAAAGEALRACHAALATYHGKLPPLTSLFDEARTVLGAAELPPAEHDVVNAALTRAVTQIAGAKLPVQPVHGDAGLGNVLPGPLWNDWEDCCEAPPVWDLACLVATPRIQGSDVERAAAALSAYGEALGTEQLETFVFARAAQIAAWSALSLARGNTTPERFARRLSWLEAR